MNKYCITIATNYGELTIDDVFADSQEEAITKANELAQAALDSCKVGEIHEY